MSEQPATVLEPLEAAGDAIRPILKAGHEARLAGDLERAAQVLPQAVAQARERGERGSLWWSLHELGETHRTRGEFDAARRAHAESVVVARAWRKREFVVMGMVLPRRR